jgi:hypothetical protein
MTEPNKAEAVRFVKNFCIRRSLQLIQQEDLERAMAALQIAIAASQCLEELTDD